MYITQLAPSSDITQKFRYVRIFFFRGGGSLTHQYIDEHFIPFWIVKSKIIAAPWGNPLILYNAGEYFHDLPSSHTDY